MKDQLIRGIYNSVLQTDILAKADSLLTMEEVVKHAEAFETALHDQSKLQDSSRISRVSDYKRQNKDKYKKMYNEKHQQDGKPTQRSPNHRPCNGCGESHGEAERRKACPAWGQNCENCGTPNHFASVCRQKKNRERRNNQSGGGASRNAAGVFEEEFYDCDDDSTANAIIAHVAYKKSTDSYTAATKATIHEIPAQMTPMLPRATKPAKTTSMMIFPDSGAGICLAGPQHISRLGIPLECLIRCNKKVTAVGGSVLSCMGWLPVEFRIGNNTTRQPLYVCQKIDRIYLSRQGCTEANILPTSFPYPMDTGKSESSIGAVGVEGVPKRPLKIPYPPTDGNVARLKEYLVNSFETVFNRTRPFREMNCKPAHIHLKRDAVPFATHVPIPVPIHWKEQVKSDLDRDVEDGIIEKVPVGEPVQWCSPMVVTAKKRRQASSHSRPTAAQFTVPT